MSNNHAVENIKLQIANLFTFKGKISRLKFSIGALIVFFVFISLFIAIEEWTRNIRHLSSEYYPSGKKFAVIIFLIVWLLDYILATLSTLSISIRRLNDLGLSSKLSLIYFILLGGTLILILDYLEIINIHEFFIGIVLMISCILAGVLTFLLCFLKGIDDKK